ncbi:MAG: TonB-dependent receptor, partial [Bacteroidota bacterium]
NEEFSGHFDVNVGWQKWALVTSISANSYGDLRMGNNGPSSYLRPSFVERFDSTDVVVNNSDPQLQVPSGFDQINLMQKLRFKPSEKWDIEYGFHYSETTPYSRYDRQLRTRNGLPRYGEWAYGPQIWMMNNLSATHTHPNLIFDQFTLRAAHQYFEESRISRNFNSPDRAIRTEQVDAYSLNLDFSKKWDSNTTLFYGLEWVLNQVNSTGLNENINTGTTSPGPSRYPQADWQSYAAYLTAQIQLNEQLHLQAGARYGRNLLNATFDTTFFPFPFTTTSLNAGATTGSLGLVYRPTSTWVLSATIANGFRAPNVDDAGKVFDSEPGAVVVPNPNLRPEFAYNVELGLAKIIGDFIKLDVTAYYTFLDNALVRRNFTLNGQDSILYENQPSQVQAIQNAASANVYGVQAGVEVKLPNGFRLATRLNYQVGEEELNDGTRSPSRHAAPFFGLARLNYRKDKLQLQFNIQFSDAVPFEDMPVSEIGKPEIYAQDANGNPFSPSWYTLNFKALYQLEQHFSLSAGLENITDQRYRPYSSGLVAPGRNFILALRAEF